jgi:hypothetical protein
MKLQHSIRTAVLAGLAVIAIPYTAQAALTFDSWTVSSGAISYTCPAGITCTTLVTGEGFLQQEYNDGTNSYIQTIITDATASGNPGSLSYSDESFVRATGTSAGIVGKQTISDNTTPGFTFTSSSELYTGWGVAEKPGNKANLNISQGFIDTGVANVYGDEFSSNFDLKVNLDTSGNQTGKSMSIGQVVEMGDGSAANTQDIQRFIVEQRAGDLQTQSNAGFRLGSTSFDVGTGVALNGTDGTSAIGTGGDGTANSGAATWQSGDDVMLVWLGQEVSAQTPGSTGGLSIFGYESVTVVGDTTNPTPTTDQFASTFSTSTPGVDTATVDTSKPFNWDEATFGASTTPILPAPAVDAGGGTFTDSGACEVSGSTADCLN